MTKTKKPHISNGNFTKQGKASSNSDSLIALINQNGHNNRLSGMEGIWEEIKKFGRKMNHRQTFDFSRGNIATGIGIDLVNRILVSITASSIGKPGDETTHSERRIIAAAEERNIELQHIFTERQACNSCQEAMNKKGISSSFIVPYNASFSLLEKREISEAVNLHRYKKTDTEFPSTIYNTTINNTGYPTDTEHSSEEHHSPAEEYFGKSNDFLANRRRARQNREKKSGIESRVPETFTPKSEKPKANNSNFKRPKADNFNFKRPKANNSDFGKPGKSLRRRLFKGRQ